MTQDPTIEQEDIAGTEEAQNVAEDTETEEKIVVERDVPEVIPEDEEEVAAAPRTDKEKIFDRWQPKTELGRKVKAGQVTNIDSILDKGQRIMEAEIVDTLLPNLNTELLMIGQSKGKFGGGARRVFRQTQKKTPEGNKPSFGTYAVVGDGNGHFGVGYGKSRDTVPAREKAIRNAKLNIMRIQRGYGSWEDAATDPHSIPFTVHGKCGSVEITLKPAPKGKGLVVEKECQKILKAAGIQDIWSKTQGQTRVKVNLIVACIRALKQLTSSKTQPQVEQVAILPEENNNG